MNNTFGIIYSNPSYILISITIFLSLFFPLITISEFLFFEPFLVFSIYPETILSFSLIVTLSIFAALAVSLNLYRVKLIKEIDEFSTSCKNAGSVFEMLFTANNPSPVFSSQRQLRTPESCSAFLVGKSPSIT